MKMEPMQGVRDRAQRTERRAAQSTEHRDDSHYAVNMILTTNIQTIRGCGIHQYQRIVIPIRYRFQREA
jgi:hypothetical protein